VSSPPRPEVHLLTAISFHYHRAKLPFLRAVAAEQPSLGATVTLNVFTNASAPQDLESIEACLPPASNGFGSRIIGVPPQAHPYFLTWAHKHALRTTFIDSPGLTHFLYLEDDILVTRANVAYWLSARETLRPFGLLPGFFRVERRGATGRSVSTDLTRRIRLWKAPALRLDARRWFIGLDNPYHAMYLFDRELALEHMAGPAINPDFGPWRIREQAAQGQTFVGAPPGFRARTVVPFDPEALRIPSECHVRHLPNNYGDDEASPFGKIELDDLVRSPALARAYARLASLTSGRPGPQA